MPPDKHLKIRKFVTSWLNEPWAQGWLTKSEDGLQDAFCKLCRTTLRAHKSDLTKHATTKMHKQRSQALVIAESSTMRNHVISVKNEDKERDLILAFYIAMHSAVKSIDHLADVWNKIKIGGQQNNLRLHRTKCSLLIKRVLAPALEAELLEDVKNAKYSLIIDVSVIKYLCICIKYFSKRAKRITNDFLGIIVVDDAKADSLYKYLTEFLSKINLSIENLIGIGTDGANNMCGKFHSLFTLLKAQNDKIQLVKCICHSLNLAASHSADELPANIEFLCREIYNWFNHSPQRRIMYMTLFNILNGSNKKFHNFVQLSQTLQ